MEPWACTSKHQGVMLPGSSKLQDTVLEACLSTVMSAIVKTCIWHYIEPHAVSCVAKKHTKHKRMQKCLIAFAVNLHDDVCWSELAQHSHVAHSIHLADDYLGLAR